MSHNPYTASRAEDDSPALPRPITRLTSGDAARRLFAIGMVGGALIGSIGYLLMIGFVEILFVPPLKSPPDYGQFVIVVMGVAFYMTVFGMALAVVPYVNWIGYVPIHVTGVLLIWAADRKFFSEVDWREAPIAVMLILFALPTVVAIFAHLWYRNHAEKL